MKTTPSSPQGHHGHGAPETRETSRHQRALLLVTEVEDSSQKREVTSSTLTHKDWQHKFYHNGRCFKSYVATARTEDILKMSCNGTTASVSLIRFTNEDTSKTKRHPRRGPLILPSCSETNRLAEANFSRHLNNNSGGADKLILMTESLPKLYCRLSHENSNSHDTSLRNSNERTTSTKVCPSVRSLTLGEFSGKQPENDNRQDVTADQPHQRASQPLTAAVIHVKPKEPDVPVTEQASHANCASEDAASDHVTKSGRQLWDRVGLRLGLRHRLPACKDGTDEGARNEHGASGTKWVWGPGDILRPAYARWDARRHALADPERMCMPQAVRERVQSDVETRKRSLVRRMSHFLNVKLHLNLEEDLHF